ncbi:DUF4352 domain-containing protein [Actinoplanes sp. M2I2]|uniref:DUF4352 domain-containing protein n=1 Tax=Actinoplanes sp. M2I2 TaxID=1734444 RepID=UPI002022423E|nr:DUF4352 domain-containing protein [Actinoplanes sp. M2I2]
MSYDSRTPSRPGPRWRLNPLVAGLLAVGSIAALFLAGVAAQRLGSREPVAAATPGASPGATTKITPSAKPPGLGDPVRDGAFAFVVTKVDCSRTTVGPERLRRTAKGKYCLISLSVRNTADGWRYFLGHAQKALDADGAGYGTDALAGLYANRDTQTFLQRLGPGERVNGQLAFDVPATVELTAVDLHDSPLSGGVRVTLR